MSSPARPENIQPQEAADIAKLREALPLTTESYGMPLDDACLARYLRAREGDVDKASTMLRATLDWRRDFGLPEVLSNDKSVIAKENSTGKVYVSGSDKQGRPILVMRPRCENTMDHDGNIKHLVYQMERARAILQRTTGGQGKICIMLDYEGYSLRNAPPMKTSMHTLKILQNHYPETLGVAYFLSPPLIFRGFWNVIYPFIDKVTKEKFVFVKGNLNGKTAQAVLAKNFNLDQLEEAFGGRYATQFDSAIYIAAPMDQDFRQALTISGER